MRSVTNTLGLKTIIKIFIIIGLLFSFFMLTTNAGLINIGDLDGLDKIQKNTISKTGSGDIVQDVENFGFSILQILKVILQGILLIYVVYIGGSMIISMGSDDAKITNAKNQLWYSLVAIVFINIPGTLFSIISQGSGEKNISGGGAGSDFTDSSSQNILLNFDLFGSGLSDKIISTLQVLIFIIAIYTLIMAGIKIMTSRGRDEKITEAKGKILYSIFAMIFISFIEAWKQLAVTGKISYGTSIFGKMVDMSLLFAGPVVMVFLTIAGYYYITANSDEDKIKKAKSIVINTFIGILLLLIMVTFLNDLITL